MGQSSHYLLSQLKKPLQGCSDSPLLDARFFLSDILQCPLAEVFHGVRLTDAEFLRFMSMCRRRQKSEPVAYILGYTWFWGMKFSIDRSVLIPRPDTECLVECVLNRHSEQASHVLEFGIGSGVIALSIASDRPLWQIDGIERSKEAMSCAMTNHHLHQGHSDQVRFYEDNWYALASPVCDRYYDLIVSNPPYVSLGSKEVSFATSRFEPEQALYADGQGLEDIQHIISLSWNHLHNCGWLYLEHGFDQALSVRDLFQSFGYRSIETIQDYSGHDRVTYAQKYQSD